MNEKEIDGKTYILKSDVENIVKQRVSSMQSKLAQAEDKQNEYKAQLQELENKNSNVSSLEAQLLDLQQQLQTKDNKFNRYQAIAKLGYAQDQDIVEAIEWAYEKQQSKLPKKDQSDLSTWLQNCVENPQNAPSILRPHLQNTDRAQLQSMGNHNQQTRAAEETTVQHETQNVSQPIISPNRGALPTPETPTNIIERGIKDPEFYAQNREAIAKAWRNRARNALRE